MSGEEEVGDVVKRCENCSKPAKHEDCEGVPLCGRCYISVLENTLRDAQRARVCAFCGEGASSAATPAAAALAMATHIATCERHPMRALGLALVVAGRRAALWSMVARSLARDLAHSRRCR